MARSKQDIEELEEAARGRSSELTTLHAEHTQSRREPITFTRSVIFVETPQLSFRAF